ncbi:MAG TPA: hypothetical protein VFA05_04365 [Gaiellaceae bacterium]|nr:hypothetical protein [Gaiellaceae bacterium]
MPVVRGSTNATGKLASAQAQTNRQARAQARKSAADMGVGFARHFNALTPPPSGGGLAPVREPQPTIAEQSNARVARGRAQLRTTAPTGSPQAEYAKAVGEPTIDNPLAFDRPEDYKTLRTAVGALNDHAQTALIRAAAYTTGVLHGHWNPGAAGHINYRGGRVVFTGSPQQRQEAAGLLSLSGTGNYAQKAAADLLGIPIGVASAAIDPTHGVPRLARQAVDYYRQDPIKNLRQDPFMFGLNYVLPAVSGVGGALGRVAALGETARALAPGADLSLADVARLREGGALQHYLEHGVPPEASAATKAKLYTRALLRPRVDPERTITIGTKPDGSPFTITASASHNHAVNLFHRYVTDRIVSHALDGGVDLLGARAKVGRMIRSNQRMTNAVRGANLSRLAKLKLSAAEEHAAWMIAKGHTPEAYAKYHQAMIDQGVGDLARHQSQLDLTKIAAQHLKPGAENAKVLKAAQVMRDAIAERERYYGRTEQQINHALGSHWYGIHTRAEGLPDLHQELAKIAEEHGPAAESPRHYLEQHAAELERYAAQSGPEHAAALRADAEHVRSLPSDVEFARHRLAEIDKRIADLGPTKARDGFVEHPENLAGTHRGLLVERSRLEDHLNALLAHERARQIHEMFEQKGAELRGRSVAFGNDQRGTDRPAEAGTRLAEGQRSGAGGSADNLVEPTEGVAKDSPEVVAAERLPGRIAPQLDITQVRSLEQHYGVEGRWTPQQAQRFHEDMLRAAKGEDVPPVVQSVFNASLVAPPEAFYLPFEWEAKPSGRTSLGFGRRRSQMGLGPPKREAAHQFTGEILDHGDFRTKASHLATTSFTKAAHWRNMQDVHEALWALSKETPEEAGFSRWNPAGAIPGRGEPVPIRDLSTIPASLKEEAYGVHPGDLLPGEAADEVAKRLFEEWTRKPEHGEHVRWINPDIIRPLEPKTAGAALRFINGINSGFRFGRYLNPGYIRWLPQNLVLNLTQQGPFIFRNAWKMMDEVKKLDPEVYHQIANAVSHGSARALESNRATRFQHGVAGFWAGLNDHVPRMLSFIHEAQRKGYRTARDWEALMTDPRLEGERNAVLLRANKEPIDYGAMTDRERVVLKSFFAYWPWIRAASLWALRFPFEHPYQMAAYSQAGAQGAKKVEDFWAHEGGVAPPYMEGYYPAKGGPIDMSAADPWSQLAEDAQAYSGLFPSHPENAGAAFGLLSPAAKPIEEVVTGRDQYGNIPKKGVLDDALNSMAKTFEPFSVLQTAREKQTGATPKGPLAAVEKWAGSPYEGGYDYQKAAANALKDVTNFEREKVRLQNDPNAKTVPRAELQLVLRVAQIKDETKPRSTQQARALELAQAAYENTPLKQLNALLVANGLKPFSRGDLIAERARQRAISP